MEPVTVTFLQSWPFGLHNIQTKNLLTFVFALMTKEQGGAMLAALLDCTDLCNFWQIMKQLGL